MYKYTIYNGKFPCHTCKEVVTSLRLYAETGELTWMCNEKHLSSVNIRPQKKIKAKA